MTMENAWNGVHFVIGKAIRRPIRMITKDEFQEIRRLIKHKEVYDLMTVLRGSDYDYPYLKYLFTARIRFFLGVSKRYAKIRTTKTIFPIEESVVLQEIEKARREQMKRHYFIHVNSALGVLKDNKMIKEDEWKILLILSTEISNYISRLHDTNEEVVKWLDKITWDRGWDK